MGNKKSNELILPERLPTIEGVLGPAVGINCVLGQNEIRIGRQDDNEIIIKSEAVSRYHASIIPVDGGQYLIRDTGSRNGTLLNGKRVEEAPLAEGDIIQLGDSAFKFTFADSESFQPELIELSPASTDLEELRTKKARPSRRLILYSLLALVLGWAWFTVNTTTEKNQEAAKDVPAVDTSLPSGDTPGGPTASSSVSKVDVQPPQYSNPPQKGNVAGLEDPALSKAEQSLSKTDWSNSAIKEAELYFRRGQREYLNRNFHRAMEAFQTTLALSRTHELANTYLRITILEAEAEAKRHREAAVRYFESMQYQRAMYHFKEAATMMMHRQNDPLIAEAEKYIMICRQRMQAAELFP